MAENYTVLARRYRSQNFDELVGQEAIAQTLKNAVSSGRVAHAFMFTGTRGVGKTSAARILAKAIECPNVKDGQPCGVCDTCQAIARGEDMDVIEIDGASNNGVDQIRELRQSAGIRPARSPYKVYIIDEVHMLSGGAFNALLKTLEEPPSHVKFIFATTDIHKVPATIISRCQRFDFKNIPTAKIAEHLRRVVESEHLSADREALFRIARLGNGSMRDALSLLDRVLSLGEKHITEKILEELLGKPASAAIAELAAAIAQRNPGLTLQKADALLQESMGVEQVLSELVEFFRNLMLVSVCGKETDLLEVQADQRPMFVSLAGQFDAPSLVHAIALCEQTLRNLKSSTMGRPLFDALLVRLSLSEQFSSIAQLMKGDGAAGAQKKNDLANGLVDPPAEPEVAAEANLPAVPEVIGEATVVSHAPHDAPPVPTGAAEPTRSHFQELQEQLKNRPQPQPIRMANGRPTLAGRPGAAARPAANGEAVAIQPVASAETPEERKIAWQRIRQHLVATRNQSLENMVGEAGFLGMVTEAQARVSLPENIREMVERSRDRLEASVRAVLGRPVQLVLEYFATKPAPQQAVVAQARRVPPEVEKAVYEAPLVRTLIERLDAKVTSVELLDE